MKIRARSKLWLEHEDGSYVMGPRTARLLQAIDHLGSLKQAAQEADFSYRAAWNRLRRVEKVLGYALVESSVGGPGGGSSELSSKGKTFLAAFLRLEQQSKRLESSFLLESESGN